MMQTALRPYLKYIPIFILILGIALRLNVFFQNRSLIIDEANLARYVIKNDWSDFFMYQDKNEAYRQYAPPLFSVVSKASIKLGGCNEYMLKWPSLVASILTLILLLALLHYYWGNSVVNCYILSVFACSVLSIRYSSEFKQYALDGLLALGFVGAAIRSKANTLDLKKSIQWALSGAIAVWMSMSVVFVLAAVGLAFLYKWKLGNIKFGYLMGIAAAWLLSFGWYFFTILVKDAADPALISYHRPFFFELWPNSMEALHKNYQLLLSLFRTPTDQTVVSIVLAMLSFVVGIASLLKKDRYSLILLLTPIILTYIASGLGVYTLIERLILFLVPFVLLTMAFGLQFMWKKAPLAGKLLLLTCMILSVANSLGYRYFWTSMEFEDSKSTLRFIDSVQKDAPIFVEHSAVAAFEFYNDLHEDAWHFEHYYNAKWNELPSQGFLTALKKEQQHQFWLFLAHTHPTSFADKFVQDARNIGQQQKDMQRILSAAYLFQLKE